MTMTRTHNGVPQEWAQNDAGQWEWQDIPAYRLQPIAASAAGYKFRDLVQTAQAAGHDVVISWDEVLIKGPSGWHAHHVNGTVTPQVECTNGAVIPPAWLNANGLFDGHPVVQP